MPWPQRPTVLLNELDLFRDELYRGGGGRLGSNNCGRAAVAEGFGGIVIVVAAQRAIFCAVLTKVLWDDRAKSWYRSNFCGGKCEDEFCEEVRKEGGRVW